MSERLLLARGVLVLTPEQVAALEDLKVLDIVQEAVGPDVDIVVADVEQDSP